MRYVLVSRLLSRNLRRSREHRHSATVPAAEIDSWSDEVDVVVIGFGIAGVALP
jgi:hypothetical protein